MYITKEPIVLNLDAETIEKYKKILIEEGGIGSPLMPADKKHEILVDVFEDYCDGFNEGISVALAVIDMSLQERQKVFGDIRAREIMTNWNEKYSELYYDALELHDFELNDLVIRSGNPNKKYIVLDVDDTTHEVYVMDSNFKKFKDSCFAFEYFDEDLDEE